MRPSQALEAFESHKTPLHFAPPCQPPEDFKHGCCLESLTWVRLSRSKNCLPGNQPPSHCPPSPLTPSPLPLSSSSRASHSEPLPRTNPQAPKWTPLPSRTTSPVEGNPSVYSQDEHWIEKQGAAKSHRLGAGGPSLGLSDQAVEAHLSQSMLGLGASSLQ